MTTTPSSDPHTLRVDSRADATSLLLGGSRTLTVCATAAAALLGAAARQWGDWEGAVLGALALGVLAAAVPVAPVLSWGNRRRAEETSAQLAEPVVARWQQVLGQAQRATQRQQRQLDTRLVDMAQQLDASLQQHASACSPAPGIDSIVERHRPTIDVLLHHSRSTARLRHETLDVARAMTQALTELNQLAREVQTISRATHLLALNASVEATRAGERGGGFAVVAQEVRQLAAQSRQAGMRIARQVDQIQAPLDAVLQHAGRDDVDPDASADAIGLLAEEHARRVVRAVVESGSECRQTARALYEQCQQVQVQMHGLQDSLRQVARSDDQAVEIVQRDMQRLRQWLHGADDPAASATTAWLQRLEIDTQPLRQHRTKF